MLVKDHSYETLALLTTVLKTHASAYDYEWEVCVCVIARHTNVGNGT